MTNIKINILIYSLLLVILFPLHISHVYAFEWSSELRLSITEEYNDNLYLDRNDEEEDYITVITPGIKAALDWQRTGLSAAYDLGYSKYNDHSENDGFRHRGDVGLWWNVFQNTKLSFNDTYIKSEDIADSPQGETERDGRAGYYSNSSQINLFNRFGENKHVAYGYVYTINKYEDDGDEDNESHKASIDSTYFFNPHLGMETHVVYTNGLYDVSQDFDEWIGTLKLLKNISRRLQINGTYTHTSMKYQTGGDDNNYQIYNPSAGFRYILGDEVNMGINIGYFVQDIDSQDNEKGLTVDGNIGHSWRFRQGNITLTGMSGYGNSALNTENLGFNVFYGADTRFNYQFSRYIMSSIYGNYRHNDYVNSSPGDSDRKDKTITSGCSLNWQITKWLNTGIDYNYRNVNSSIDENDFTENRVMLKLNLVSQFGRIMPDNN